MIAFHHPHLVPQVVQPQGWSLEPVKVANTTAEVCGDANSSAAKDGRRVPRWVCRLAIALRRHGAPLRRFVGYEFHLSREGAPWFVDGPMSLIIGLVSLAAGLPAALVTMSARCQVVGYPPRRAPPP